VICRRYSGRRQTRLLSAKSGIEDRPMTDGGTE
jgi:hypothetical protein